MSSLYELRRGLARHGSPRTGRAPAHCILLRLSRRNWVQDSDWTSMSGISSQRPLHVFCPNCSQRASPRTRYRQMSCARGISSTIHCQARCDTVQVRFKKQARSGESLNISSKLDESRPCIGRVSQGVSRWVGLRSVVEVFVAEPKTPECTRKRKSYFLSGQFLHPDLHCMTALKPSNRPWATICAPRIPA